MSLAAIPAALQPGDHRLGAARVLVGSLGGGRLLDFDRKADRRDVGLGVLARLADDGDGRRRARGPGRALLGGGRGRGEDEGGGEQGGDGVHWFPPAPERDRHRLTQRRRGPRRAKGHFLTKS